MKADPDCIPYALSQVLATARLVTEDEWIHRKVLLRVLGDLAEETDLDQSAPEIIFTSLATAYKALGVKDPYENQKARANKAFSVLAEELREEIRGSDEPLEAALSLALAGAGVDATEVQDRVAAEHSLRASRAEEPARDDREGLLRALGRAESVFYILNNAGEVILDRLFIEELARKRQVTVTARHAPILTDVTVEEAEAMGFGEMENVALVDPGVAMLGIWREKASNEMRQAFDQADVVIAKGQANYESLAAAERPVFFLMRARSVAIANRLGVEPERTLLYRHRPAEAAEPA